ncbi:single-stranded DNA-binding protein [Macrococcus animalis]|uniref:single-stranded DNA-binding protein n=1 Tax=Macrococcus animalis TaxID=3395467 RepID=UPI0039BE8996
MINKVILAGRISSDIDLKSISENLQISSFFIAVDRGKKKDAKESTVDFLRCKAFNRTAVNIHSYCKKGSLICITGQIHNNRYEKDGEKRYSTEIIIESIKFLPYIGGNNKQKSPDDKWDEFSYEEKLMVINDYNERKKGKQNSKNEAEPAQQIEPIVSKEEQTSEPTLYNQRWSTELNKEEEKVSAEYKEKAEEIIQEFTGESSIKCTDDAQEKDAYNSIEESESTNVSVDNSKTDEEIIDKSMPF